MSRNNIFWFFFGFLVYPLGGSWNYEKTWIFAFSKFGLFGLFNQYNHEKSTKIIVIFEICVVKFKKSTNTPGGNQFSDHHGGLNSKILSKKGRKISFSQFWPLEICRTCIKNHSRQTWTLYGWNESSTSTDRPHLCTPRGVKFAYFDEKWPKIMVFW